MICFGACLFVCFLRGLVVLFAYLFMVCFGCCFFVISKKGRGEKKFQMIIINNNNLRIINNNISFEI